MTQLVNRVMSHSLLNQCLGYAGNATAEDNQQYDITTFDLRVCMKAYPLVWNNPEKYDKHIILIGMASKR